MRTLAIILALMFAAPLAMAKGETKTDVAAEVTTAAPDELPPVVMSPATKAEADPFGTVQAIVNATKTGNWRLVASLLLAVLMLALSKVRDKIAWFSGDRGGAVLVMVLALCGTLSAALATSVPISASLIFGALGVCWTAVGGYSWVRRLIWPAPPPKKR